MLQSGEALPVVSVVGTIAGSWFAVGGRTFGLEGGVHGAGARACPGDAVAPSFGMSTQIPVLVWGGDLDGSVESQAQLANTRSPSNTRAGFLCAPMAWFHVVWPERSHVRYPTTDLRPHPHRQGKQRRGQ